jgi:Mg2+ and Co2+ transporter CorA
MKGILYELYDYPFTYLLYRPDDKRAVVLVEDGIYAMQNPKRPRLKIFPNDPFERTILVVLPFWIYPSNRLLERANRVLEIDPETTAKIFNYAEKTPVERLDEYCILKMRELSKENTEGIFEIVDNAELF